MSHPHKIIAKSYSKLNLGLLVPFRYPSGYHHIVSLFVPISFADEIEFKYEKEKKFEIIFEDCLPNAFKGKLDDVFSQKSIPDNLMYRAFEMIEKISDLFLSKNINVPEDIIPRVSIKIKKRVPSPAGLGGGSSNAASLISFFIEIFEKNIKDKYLRKQIHEFLHDESLKLGSDIPFFLSGKPALVSGIGEIKEEVKIPQITGILGLPPFGFATATMYKTLKKTLQTENDLNYNLGKAENRFHKFVDQLWLESEEGIKNNAPENGDMPENEFLTAAENIYPEETKLLAKAMKEVSKVLEKNLFQASIKRKIYTSMSGSGASFFAFIVCDKQTNNNLNGALKKTLNEIEKASPEISWVNFHSV